MTNGIVNRLEAIVEVTILFPNLTNVKVECVIDTGFAGALTLSAAKIADLELPFFNRIRATLANGNEVRTPSHIATIILEGKEISVLVISMGVRPLMGTALLEGRRICAEFVEGGKVTIESL